MVSPEAILGPCYVEWYAIRSCIRHCTADFGTTFTPSDRRCLGISVAQGRIDRYDGATARYRSTQTRVLSDIKIPCASSRCFSRTGQTPLKMLGPIYGREPHGAYHYCTTATSDVTGLDLGRLRLHISAINVTSGSLYSS
jgi:hypothetical protein